MSSPIDIRDTTDPGDNVLRKFRYQHAYGVILSIGIMTGRLDYVSLWCEQHEDFLAETASGLFDAYQVKTRRSEIGDWQINDDAFCGSVQRFVDLHEKFPDQLRKFLFVSNTDFSQSRARGREHLSPVIVLRGIKDSSSLNQLSGEIKKGFEWIRVKLNTDEERLYSVLRRTDLVLGPTERGYEDEICGSHISSIPSCSTMNAASLRKTLENMISAISYASSLVSSDPSKHWVGLMEDLRIDPYLSAKKISKDDFNLISRDALDNAFGYLPIFASIELGGAEKKLDTLQKKLERGGLAGRYEIMRRQSLTAEQKLLDLATRGDHGGAKCSQIENVVFSECDEANLRASQGGGNFGAKMLIDVQDRLRKIAEEDSALVHNQAYYLLLGVAGLLTSDCKVWWSEKFDVADDV